ncbi:LacI family DNA-binding transcriptional regulator [Phaeovulum sp. W22_SRMD_FR3]|uniref:LacI family DNA-binding transcriptional regulator n=1 Tax=Phaeovulum sp. W22_SRMD_FR3 TaxID=3240274 RepID=UPI003F9630F7
MARRPRIHDLAEAAGVSVATVDRVLNGRHAVRAETADRVYAAAKRIGYHAAPLLEKRVGAPKRSLHIGLLLHAQEADFYRSFKSLAEAAARADPRAKIRLSTAYLPSQNPAEVVAALEAMAARVQMVAMVAIDHPLISEAVAGLKARGVPVFALLSDFAQGARAAYIGTNNLRVGRTAAWMLARGMARPAKVALFVGGHRWHGHELRETGFRSYFRQEHPEVTLIDTQVNLDTPQLAYEAVLSLLARHADLAGIFCAGGGMEGIIQAIRDERRAGNPRAARVDIVVNELTEVSRHALADGLVSLVIDTPVTAICQALFTASLAALAEGPGEAPGQIFLPPVLILPESL